MYFFSVLLIFLVFLHSYLDLSPNYFMVLNGAGLEYCPMAEYAFLHLHAVSINDFECSAKHKVEEGECEH